MNINLFVIVSLLFNSLLLKAQYLVSATLLESKTGAQVTSLISQIGVSGSSYAVDTYKILYNTKDAFNNSTVASGAIMIPKNTPCDTFPILSNAHGTVLKKTEVPSQIYNSNIQDYFFAAKGYVVTMPDFLGLGDNNGFQAYIHSETEAKSSLDLIRAAREYISTTSTKLNGKIFVTGYSQGGHAAMATMKFVQDFSLTAEFNIVAGAPLSGPYSLSREQSRIVYGNYNYNAFLPMVIKSYQSIYGNLYGNINAYYDAPYDVNIPPYLTGTSTFSSLNAALPVNAFNFMQDTMLNNFIADTFTFSHPLRKALKLNDNYNWKPNMPVRLCYCSADDIVRATNTKMAFDTMNALGAVNVTKIDVSPFSNHLNCNYPAIIEARNWFNTFRSDCNYLTQLKSEVHNLSHAVKYPNPASGEISIICEVQMNELEILEVSGKLAYKSIFENNTTFKINSFILENGIYFLKIKTNQGLYTNKILINN